MKKLSKNIVAIDYSYLGPRFGAILDGGAITTFEQKRFSLELDEILALSERYQAKHFIFTGPGTSFLPNKHGDLVFEKKSRLESLAMGLHFLTTEIPTLIVLFELGCHLFYCDKETIYLGSLPYSFASFGLAKDISVNQEMGEEINGPLQVCQTHTLPHTRMLERYENLLAYTLALGIKEFQARYKIPNTIIGGTITREQHALLSSFLSPTIPSPQFQISNASTNSQFSIVNSQLPFPQHIAIFGMLSPYLETDAGEN